MDRRVASIADFAPFPPNYSEHMSLARLAYAVCKATRPAVVLEVGVAYGKTSACVLKAPEVNQTGDS